jgi:hypothetical protein
MFRNTAVVPALLVLLTYSPGCKEEPPANEPGEFCEPCVEGALADTPDGCADGLECYKGYCEETCVEDTDCRPIEGWTHECVVGQCQILCGADASCPQTLGTSMECGALMWCVSKDD